MKTKIKTIVASLTLITPLAAFPPFNPPIKPPIKPPVTPGDLSPLEALADKFVAFQNATLRGESFYSKADTELQKKHSETYSLITESLTSERIDERLGGLFLTELIRLGQTHESQLAGAASLSKADQEAAAKSLVALQKKIKEDTVEKVVVEVLTPEINKVQQTMYELCLFTQSDEKLAGKTSSLLRRLKSHIEDEHKIKEDGEVSDREREKSMKDLSIAWEQYISIIKR